MRSIEVTGFAADCRIYGRLTLTAERLTDLLNGQDPIVLQHVLLESLEDGHLVELPELTVHREDLYAVVGSGPRGSSHRRVRTRPYPVELALGPYLVTGQLHALPGANPVVAMLRRGPFVPLTNAAIAFVQAGEQRSDVVDTLLVHRLLVDWVRPARESPVVLPVVEPPLEPASGPTLAKDFTGSLEGGLPL